MTNVPSDAHRLPRFDWIILGLGHDGHTASLFPDQLPSNLCAVTIHPQTGHHRITMNYKLINHAHRISFIVQGSHKAKIVAQILNKTGGSTAIPAAQIRPVDGICEWYMDEAAAAYL